MRDGVCQDYGGFISGMPVGLRPEEPDDPGMADPFVCGDVGRSPSGSQGPAGSGHPDRDTAGCVFSAAAPQYSFAPAGM